MDLFVTADDRTGAFETAAVLADRSSRSVDVHAWPVEGHELRDVVVVDLGTRHLTPGDARARVAAATWPVRRGHKIDSTLRGNWPEELAALVEHRPVLLVPALPGLGRTCVDGVVLEHGRPVHEGDAGSDVRRRITTSRPSDLLRAAAVRDVVGLPDVDAAITWLADARGVAVADAADDVTIELLVAAWRDTSSDVILAGTSAVVGAAVGDAARPPQPVPPIRPPVLVVCGSVHPVARTQLARAEQVGIPVATLADELTARRLAGSDVLVLATEIPVGDVAEPLAVASATALARGVDFLWRSVEIGALIVIGGDTAAAVLGPSAVRVHGSVAPGTAWATAPGIDAPVITRAGGFGGEGALVDLIRDTLHV